MKKFYLINVNLQQQFKTVKKIFFIFLLGLCCLVSLKAGAQSLTNGGFEANTTYPGTGWSGAGGLATGTISTATPRTGVNNLLSSTTGTTLNGAYIENSSTVTVASSSYLHIICWARQNTGANGIIWFSAGNSNSVFNQTGTSTTYTQYSGNIQNTGNATTGLSGTGALPDVGFKTTNGTARSLLLDDVVAYTDANATSDLTAPPISTGFTNGTITSSSVGFSWTNSTDVTAPATGVRGSIILRTTNTAAAAPTLNNQGIYSVAGGTSGPKLDVSGNWTVIGIITTSTNGSAGSYTDNTVASGTSYKYAVIDYDLAFNYSTALVSSTITTTTPACTTPSAPSSVALGVSTVSTQAGTITAPGTAPTGYIVIASTNSTLSSGPSNTNTYIAGNPLGGGIVQYVGTGISFTAGSSLTSNTLWYYFVYSYNSACTGQPVYSTTSVTANKYTCIDVPTSLAAGSVTSTSASISWTAPAGTITSYDLKYGTTSGSYTSTVTGVTSPYALNPPLTAGQTYYYVIVAKNTSNNSTCGASTQSAESSFTTLPVNDDCVNAVTITPGTTCVSTSGSTAGATQQYAPILCNGFTAASAKEVWYKFTADGTSSYTISATGSASVDLVLSYYSTCGGAVIGCSDATTTGGTESIAAGPLAAGIYYYRLYDYSAVSGSFTTCVTYVPACTTPGPPTTPPANLGLTPVAGGTSMTGSFTAPVSTATNYLVIRTTTSAAPTAPTNTVTYTAGSSALGGIIVSVNSTTSFTDNGLTPSTPYWYWVYSYNATTCAGGPLYSATYLSGTNTTSACVSNTLYWAGVGSTLNQTIGTDWNTAANWSTTSGSYTASTYVPNSCTDVNFPMTQNVSSSVAMSASATVKSVTATLSATGNRTFTLTIGTNSLTTIQNFTTTNAITKTGGITVSIASGGTLLINGNLSCVVSNTVNSFFTSTTQFLNSGTMTVMGTTLANALPTSGLGYVLFLVGNSPAITTFNGDVTLDDGSSDILNLCGIGGISTTSTGTTVFNANLNLGNEGGTSTIPTASGIVFNGPGNQTITDNTSDYYFAPSSFVVGGSNNPTVSLVKGTDGGYVDPYTNLTINGSSTLNVSANATINNYSVPTSGTATGTLSVNSTATLKLAGTTGGQTGSNFPSGYATTTLNSTSTVEYYATGSPTIFATPTYGNLTLGDVTLTPATVAGVTAGLTVAGNLLINPSATFASSTFAHSVSGNWVNNGTFTNTASTNSVTFNGSSDATISGISSTAFYKLIINKGSSIATNLNVTSTVSVTNTLTFTNGLLRIQTGGNFTANTAGPNITTTSGVHVNGGTFTNNGSTITNDGLFRLTTGTANIGSGTGNSLQNSSTATCDIQGGNLNIASRLESSGGSLSQSGGTITICTVSNTTAATGNWNMSATSNLNITGGNLIIRNPNTNASPFNSINILNTTGTKTITGGTIQIGDASTPAGATFIINSPIAFNNFTVNNTNTPSVKLATDLTLGTAGVLTMNGGNIDANGKTLYVSNSATTAISRSAGFVIGNLKRAIAITGSAYLWPVGVSTNYTPATYNFAALTAGDLNIIANAGEHPQIGTSSIDPAHDVNAYWSVTTSNAASTSYSGSYGYPSTLNDFTTDAPNYINGKYSGTTWSNVPLSGAPTSTVLSFTGGSGFSDFVIGKCKTITAATVGSNQSVCDGGSVTLTGSVPTAPEVGTWSISAEPAGGNTDIFSNINAYNSTFTPKNGAGDYKLVWTISQAAPCSGTSSNSGSPLIITVYTPSSAAGMTAHASAVSICAAGTVHLTQTGGVLGTGAHFEWSTDANFTAGFTVGTSTASDAALDVIVTSNTTYYVRISGGTAPCSTGNLPATAPYPSVSVATSVDIWTGLAALSGGSATDWFDANNWCGGVPDKNTSILIPLVAPGFPIIPDLLSHGVAYVKDIKLAGATASITVSGTGVLNLHGSINTPLGGIVDFTDGTLGLDGTAQQISGSTFKDRTIKNLVDSTSASLSASHDDTLNITGIFSFGNSTGDPAATFNTNDNLTLKSTAAGTASVADITNNGATPGNSITGAANVERYIQAGRKWRFLAINTSGAPLSFQNSWMEGQTPGHVPTLGDEAIFGRGMWITGTGAATGFDASSPGATIKYWDPIAFTYIPITDPTSFNIRSNSAYMTFVRGDRMATNLSSITPPSTSPGNAVLTSTVLRTKGNLIQGTQSIPLPSGTQNITSIGNPFAAAIDLTKLAYTPALSASATISMYVWDPQLGGTYTLGAFQTLTSSGPGQPFLAIPGSGSYTADGSGFTHVNTVESGQAFYIKGMAASETVGIPETTKTIANINYPFFAPGQEERLMATLNLVSAGGTGTLVDGTLVRFNTTYNTGYDANDAKKLVNTSENVSVKRDNQLLAVEYRGIPDEADTVQFNMTGLRVSNYQWKLNLFNMDQPGRAAFLIDRYLNTETLLNLTGATTYDFPVVNIAGSFATNRFLVVFRPALAGPLPVTLTSISATRLADKTVVVKWHTENEIAINHYELQRSGNGSQFISIASDQSPTNNAGGSAAYSKIDLAPLNGDNYYRIKAISNNGHVQYSAIVKVDPIVKDASISIYPNPISDRVMNLKFAGETPGKYELQLSDKAGRTVYTATVTITDGNEVKSLNIGDGLRSGGYDLVILGPDGKKRVIQIVLE